MFLRRSLFCAQPAPRCALLASARAVAAATNGGDSAAATGRRWGSAQVNRLSFVDHVDAASHCVEDGMGRPNWSLPDVEKVVVTHKPPSGLTDRLAYGAVRACRWGFDTFSLYRFGALTERKVVTRCMFLETVAGVPGMVAGMLRHMTSLRRMRRDKGWILTLLNEAENERMHLMTFMEIRRPGYFLRFLILAAQGVMFNFLIAAYLVSPHFVHRFVGYLEEEAVITYSGIIRALDEGRLTGLATVVPEVARTYWGLPKDANFRDLICVIRADEAEHRVVNHTFADMHERKLHGSSNPFAVPRDSTKAAEGGQPTK